TIAIFSAQQDMSSSSMTDPFAAFAQCATEFSFSAGWKCRQQREAMNACMIAKATPEQMDRAREEWFRQEIERRRVKAEEDRRIEERRVEGLRRKMEERRS